MRVWGQYGLLAWLSLSFSFCPCQCVEFIISWLFSGQENNTALPASCPDKMNALCFSLSNHWMQAWDTCSSLNDHRARGWNYTDGLRPARTQPWGWGCQFHSSSLASQLGKAKWMLGTSLECPWHTFSYFSLLSKEHQLFYTLPSIQPFPKSV